MLQRRIGMICTSSGCAWWTSPRTNSRTDRAFRLAVVRTISPYLEISDFRFQTSDFRLQTSDLKLETSHFTFRRPEAFDALPELERVVEDRSNRDQAEE